MRIAAGAAQGLLRGNAWPSNAPARFWFIFVSHKLLRWLSPVTGALIVCAAAAWSSEPAARVTIALMVVIVGLALVRLVTGWKHAVVSVPFYLLFGQVAIAVGLLKGLTGRQTILWDKVDR